MNHIVRTKLKKDYSISKDEKLSILQEIKSIYTREKTKG